MSKGPRTKMSKKNMYFLDVDRNLELRHFCRQYKHWKKEILRIDDILASGNVIEEHCAEDIARLRRRCDAYKRCVKMVESSALEANEGLASYLIKGITEGISYDVLNAQVNVPCSKDMYYEYYHKFFWILDEKRL